MNTQNSYRIRDHPQSNKKQPLHTIEHISARVVVKVANNDVGPVAVDLNSIETHNNYAHELSGLNNIHGINARVIRKRGSGADNPSRTVLKKLRMTMRNASELADTFPSFSSPHPNPKNITPDRLHIRLLLNAASGSWLEFVACTGASSIPLPCHANSMREQPI